jgi:hypothetical protein
MKKDKDLQQKEAAQKAKDLIVSQRAAMEAQLMERFGAKFTEWKNQYSPRQLNVVVVEEKLAVLRPIGASEVATFSMMVANPEMGLDKATDYLLNELWLDGDTELINDEDYFISAMLQLQNVVELKKSNFYRL